MSPTTVVLIFRELHILAAAALIGAVIFNYVIVRPSLRLIPPAHAVVISQRVGTWFMWLGWIALVILGISGGVRLWLTGRLEALFMLELYETGNGRALGLMVLSWLVTVASAVIMTWLLRPMLMSKLSLQSNPDLAAVERRRTAQINASVWLERLQLINMVFAILAAVAGASVMYGGLF
jgi:uncharacterized membrane protein